jgi:hypothetical protein
MISKDIEANVCTRFYNICPTTDPTQLSFLPSLFNLPALSQCTTTLETVGDCTTEFGFTSPGTSNNDPWVDPGKLPPNGTQTLSNSQGGLASPTSGTSLVWTFGANTYTAIAASGSVGGGGGTTTTSGSGTAKGSTAQSTGTGSKPSIGRAIGIETLQLLGLGMGILLAFVL